MSPGFIPTRLTANNDFAMLFVIQPEAAARIMLRHMRPVRFKTSFPTLFSWVFRGGRLLPDWIHYRLFPPAHEQDGRFPHPARVGRDYFSVAR